MVAGQRGVDAVAAAAAELVLEADALRLAHGRVLVGAVVAVVVVVAHLRLRDAQEVVAPKLARRAAQVGAHRLQLVRPAKKNQTRNFFSATHSPSGGLVPLSTGTNLRLHPLENSNCEEDAPVGAVVVAVAAPEQRRALAVAAGELVRRARRVAVQLVGTVGAVDVAVAAPVLDDAELGTGALELALETKKKTVAFVPVSFNKNHSMN